jgi:hypothetical protein
VAHCPKSLAVGPEHKETKSLFDNLNKTRSDFSEQSNVKRTLICTSCAQAFFRKCSLCVLVYSNCSPFLSKS